MDPSIDASCEQELLSFLDEVANFRGRGGCLTFGARQLACVLQYGKQ